MLTLESLQSNLRRLAERLEYAMDDDILDDALDFDAVSAILYGLADGQSGDYIGDGLDLPEEHPDVQDE